MSKEELLRPRFKVIAGWWDMKPYKVGDIIESGQHDDLFSPYPHLFKRLEWWEERTNDELPEYVIYKGAISKVVQRKSSMGNIYEMEYKGGNSFFLDNQYHLKQFHWREVLPATESEYLEYTNSTNQVKGK